jgi:hypothetical protein
MKMQLIEQAGCHNKTVIKICAYKFNKVEATMTTEKT